MNLVPDLGGVDVPILISPYEATPAELHWSHLTNYGYILAKTLPHLHTSSNLSSASIMFLTTTNLVTYLQISKSVGTYLHTWNITRAREK